jgi:hypothetical protein
MHDLVIRFTEDPDCLPSVSRDIAGAIHAELPDADADPEPRGSNYASTDNVLRLVDLSRSSLLLVTGPGSALAAGSTGAGGGRSKPNHFSSTARPFPTSSPVSVHPDTGSRVSVAATAKPCMPDESPN